VAQVRARIHVVDGRGQIKTFVYVSRIRHKWALCTKGSTGRRSAGNNPNPF
jgi:hypothetical protein